MTTTTSKRYRDNVEEEQGEQGDDYSFHVRHSLPAPEEIHMDNPMAHKHSGAVNKKLLALIAISVFSLAAIIGLSVSIAARKSSRNVDAASSNFPRPDKTPGGGQFGRHPEQDLTQRFQDIVNYINQFEYTDSKRMMMQGTPQYKAVQWMANEDPAELDVPDSTDYEQAMEFMQRFVLAVFYYSTNGEGWKNNLNFLSDYDVCSWNERIEASAEAKVGNYDGWLSGVQCNDDEEVNYIFIPNNNLSGDLPQELGLLEAVMHFSVFGNQLTGNLPESLQEWTELTLLAVESNKMSGTLPSWMNVWTDMEYLALGSNDFTGPLPDDVFNAMPSLLEVSLHDNDFTGSFEKFNENIALETLLMQRNRLTGDIQKDSFISVPLRVLDMSYNEISGNIPYHFYDIQFVSLHHNKITGSLPTPREGHIIKFFSVFGNQMTGGLPQNIGNLAWLHHLDLSQNRFDGAIPESINSCTELVYLYLGDNEFSGAFPNLVQLMRLQELSLRNMGITGSIPDFVGSSMRRLVLLDLRDNSMEGTLPVNFKNLEHMQFLLLSNNQFSDAIPDEFWFMQQLKILGLDHNDFTGTAGNICLPSGPRDLDWFVTDDTITCDCCSEQCNSNDNACGGETILSPNVDFGYERLRFVFNAQLIFEVNLKQSN